jgi:hypothetical protein
MATLNDFIQNISEDLGVPTEDIKVDIKGGKVIVTIENIDEDDIFDEDFGLDDDSDE